MAIISLAGMVLLMATGWGPAATATLFDALWATTPPAPAIPYLLLCGVLALAAATLVGGIGALASRSIATTLAVWVGLQGLLAQDEAGMGIFMGLAMASIAWGILRRSADVGTGLGIACALVLTFIVLPRLAVKIGLPRSESLLGSVIAIVIFSVYLGWFPSFYTTTHVVDWTDWDSIFFQFKQLVMPVAVLTLFNAAAFGRFPRASVLENLNEGYVRTAR